MGHGYCYLWRPEIVWLQVGSDALITLAYYSIPVSLVYFVQKRRDLLLGSRILKASVRRNAGSFKEDTELCGVEHAVGELATALE